MNKKLMVVYKKLSKSFFIIYLWIYNYTENKIKPFQVYFSFLIKGTKDKSSKLVLLGFIEAG